MNVLFYESNLFNVGLIVDEFLEVGIFRPWTVEVQAHTTRWTSWELWGCVWLASRARIWGLKNHSLAISFNCRLIRCYEFNTIYWPKENSLPLTGSMSPYSFVDLPLIFCSLAILFSLVLSVVVKHANQYMNMVKVANGTRGGWWIAYFVHTACECPLRTRNSTKFNCVALVTSNLPVKRFLRITGIWAMSMILQLAPDVATSLQRRIWTLTTTSS